jgi:hypothetical protein
VAPPQRHGAASAVQAQDTKVGADAIKDMLSSVSSMIGMFSGSLGSVNAATSMLGQLSTTAVPPASTDADGAARRGGG